MCRKRITCRRLQILLGTLFLLLQSGLTQTDSTKISYELDLGFGTYYQFSSFGSTGLNDVSFPASIGRRTQQPTVRTTWRLDNNRVTDNPFFHGAYFVKFGGRFRYGEDFQVAASIIGEQRGFSDGIFSERTRNMYTYLNAIYSKRYGKLAYFLQAGDFWDFRMYEGLTFYNLETQSWIFKLQYGKFYFKHAGIGDLFRNIGLAIDDLYDFSFGVEEVYLDEAKSHYLDLRFGNSNNRGSIGGGFVNLSARWTAPRDRSAYAQFSAERGGGGSAFLIGSQLKFQPTAKFNIDATLEVRRYGALFNEGYTNTVYYRNPEEAATFVNSTSEVFMPLDFFERNFSQWAVYTEYQNEDVLGASAVLDLSYTLFRSSRLIAELDFNYLAADSGDFLYAFYDIGYAVQPVKDLEIALTLTNRVLNLDKNYPTLYQADRPYFLLKMYRPLRFIQENNHSHQRRIRS